MLGRPTVGFPGHKKRLNFFSPFVRHPNVKNVNKRRLNDAFIFCSPFHCHLVAILSLQHLDIVVRALSWQRCDECEIFSLFSRPWEKTFATRVDIVFSVAFTSCNVVNDSEDS